MEHTNNDPRMVIGNVIYVPCWKVWPFGKKDLYVHGEVKEVFQRQNTGLTIVCVRIGINGRIMYCPLQYLRSINDSKVSSVVETFDADGNLNAIPGAMSEDKVHLDTKYETSSTSVDPRKVVSNWVMAPCPLSDQSTSQNNNLFSCIVTNVKEGNTDEDTFVDLYHPIIRKTITAPLKDIHDIDEFRPMNPVFKKYDTNIVRSIDNEGLISCAVIFKYGPPEVFVKGRVMLQFFEQFCLVHLEFCCGHKTLSSDAVKFV